MERRLALDRIGKPEDKNIYYQSYGSLSNWGYPNITFVGSSHVHHLETAKNAMAFSKHSADMVMKSKFLGISGLTWWKCSTELHGSFTNKEKFDTYGNTWKKYDDLKYEPNFFIVILGSNDTRDLNSRLLDVKERYSYEECAMKAEQEMEEWFTALKPHIKDLFLEIKARAGNSQILYIPILLRRSWLPESRRFCIRLDEYILKQLL